mgnify:CR=1 FL=1
MCDSLRRTGQHAAYVACVGRLERPSAEDAFHAALALRLLGNVEQAADWYARAVQLRPDFAEAYLNGAYVLSEARRGAQAIEAYHAALRLRTWPADTSAAAHNNLGVLLREAGRIDEAEAAFDAAVQARPNLPEAVENLRITRGEQARRMDGRRADGLGGFHQLIHLANQRFASASQTAGRDDGASASSFEEAAELYRRATKLHDPRVDGSAYVGLGAALHGAKRVHEALEVRGSMAYGTNVCARSLARAHRPSETNPYDDASPGILWRPFVAAVPVVRANGANA